MAIDLLLALNAAVYLSLVAGLIARRRPPTPASEDIRSAFVLLDGALRKAFPDLPEGFTWREGMTKAKKKGLQLDWKELDKTLRSYEAYRYGGADEPKSSQSELLRLVRALRSSW